MSQHQPPDQSPYQPLGYGPGYGYPQPSWGAPSAAYAHWIKRVGAYFLDSVIMAPFYGAAMVLMGLATAGVSTVTRYDPTTGVTSTSTTGEPNYPLLVAAIVVYLGMCVFSIWNLWVRQGKTGYSLGKQWMGIRVVKESSLAEAPGVGRNIGRSFAHVLDALPCYLGFLWPLWDPKNQTFADKICSTIVVNQPKR